MKVIISSFLFETSIGGGASLVVNQLAQSLICAGYQVIVLTTWSGSRIKIEHADSVKVIRLPASNLYWIADKDRQPAYKKIAWQLFDVWNPLIYLLAREIIKNEAPDLVHSHKLRGLSPSIWSAAASAGVKTIVHTCHDFELISPEGLLMGKVGRLAKEQHWLMRPYQSIRKYFSRSVHHVTAPSRFLLDAHKKMDFFPSANFHIIPNTHGVCAEEFGKSSAQAFSKNTDIIRFLYIGRLDKAKGVDLLCQVFSQLLNQNHHLILTIAGWGALDVFLRETYKDHHNIQFVGSVFGTQKSDLFRASDILIAPSIAPESFGIVITEAYAYGLPVIASKIGAYSEIVKDGKTGFLVQPGSAHDLSSAILKISQHKDMIKTMSKHCLSEAQKYTPERFISDYLNIYQGHAV